MKAFQCNLPCGKASQQVGNFNLVRSLLGIPPQGLKTWGALQGCSSCQLANALTPILSSASHSRLALAGQMKSAQIVKALHRGAAPLLPEAADLWAAARCSFLNGLQMSISQGQCRAEKQIWSLMFCLRLTRAARSSEISIFCARTLELHMGLTYR